MLKNNIYTRFCVTVVLIVAVVYYPLLIALVLLPIYFFPNYIEALLVGIIIDTLYGVSGSIIYTSSVFIAFILIEFIKRRMRL